MLQEALSGAPGRHFSANFGKLGSIFESFWVSLFDASLDHLMEQTIKHTKQTTYKTQRHMAHNTHAHTNKDIPDDMRC